MAEIAHEALDLVGRMLTESTRYAASDLHLRARNHPIVRVDGALRALDQFPRLTAEAVEQIARAMMTPRQLAMLERDRQVDLSRGFKGIGRVRANIFFQRGTMALVLRIIHGMVPPLATLGLPEVVASLTNVERGLVLVTGSSGSGKTTTLAALVNEINQNQTKHVLTIEDPIEFLFAEQRSLITQREIGIDAPNFHEAMRAALREDPDVILLGEMRDTETIETALRAAETGHLVLATAHAPAAPEAVNRLITAFPSEAQAGMRVKVAQNLRAVVSQRLLPKATGKGRVVACEVLSVSALARELILDSARIKDLPDLLKRGSLSEGMLGFDASLLALVKNGSITPAVALQYATSPTDLRLKLEGF
ncbi:MAG: PilT/PilU family type 4a pilus ATPase [Gammaproteobacteria bacterium]|nr:PilT/PilU family type 4a pilus ATPase [Gammaproteobacteria bacterium]